MHEALTGGTKLQESPNIDRPVVNLMGGEKLGSAKDAPTIPGKKLTRRIFCVVTPGSSMTRSPVFRVAILWALIGA
jgi:hypothetical protein